MNVLLDMTHLWSNRPCPTTSNTAPDGTPMRTAAGRLNADTFKVPPHKGHS